MYCNNWEVPVPFSPVFQGPTMKHVATFGLPIGILAIVAIVAGLTPPSISIPVLRPRSPLYNDVSLAIGRILHPLHELDPETDAIRLRQAVARAQHSEGLL